MPRDKWEFENASGQRLAAMVERPEGEPRAWALFAHCFTCSKDVAAASRISRALAARGFAVLRFDFTGLGNSDGDFANTNFSSNVADLLAAAEHLAQEHQPVQLLVGHSLGGAAVLAAAQRIASCRAVATLGAPASPGHVQHLLAGSREAIARQGEARITLAGREFTIKRQLLEDLEAWNDSAHIAALGKALLVMHSPADAIVPIEEAAAIYAAARHPKSFVSLDGADHMLSRRQDSEHAAAVIAAWAGRYLAEAPAAQAGADRPEVAPGQVLVREPGPGLTREVYTANHQLLADEPAALGGADRGPNPYELLLAALGACTSMTVRMYAERKGIDLQRIEVTLGHDRIHAEDCRDCESTAGLVDVIDKHIHLEGGFSEAERRRLLEIAERCPVNRTLQNEIQIRGISAAP